VSLRLPRARTSLLGLAAVLLAACQTPAPGPEQPPAPAPDDARSGSVDPYRYGMFAYLAAQLARHNGQLAEAATWFARTAKVTGRADLYGEAVNASLQARDADAGERYAERWRQAAPGAVAPLLALARTRAQKEDVAGAAQAMGHVVVDHPDAAPVLRSAGERLAEVGGVSVAVRTLRKTAEAHADSAAAHLAYGHLLGRLGQSESAAGELRRALELRPDWEAAVVELAQVRPVDEGLDILHTYLADHPNALEARLRYAQGLLAGDRPGDSERVYAGLAEDRPDSAEVFMGLGLARFHQQEWDAAQEAFQRVLEIDPGKSAALFHLGRVAEEQGRYEEAGGFYSRVHAGRFLQQARLREAVTAVRGGDLQRALQLIRQMRAGNPGEPEYYRLEARILTELGQLQAAEQVADQGLERAPGHVELLYTRALIRDQRGEEAGMEADIRRIIKQRPDEARAYNFLGFSLADRGVRLDEALDLVQRANELEPDQGYIIDSLGWVHYRMGHLARAERYLRRALELTPDDPEILSHLGEVLKARGRSDEARAAWRRALANAEAGSALADRLKGRLEAVEAK